MPQICIYLELHQPLRLASQPVTSLGSSFGSYFRLPDRDNNQIIFSKVAKKSYYPMLALLKQLLIAEPKFCFSLSLSGVFVEQALTYEPKIIKLILDLVRTGRVELLAETYYHSLASLYSTAEFSAQVILHKAMLKRIFGVSPLVFRNTELIYSNDIVEKVASLGFWGMLTESVSRYLGSRPATSIYYSATESHLPLLLKQSQLSDDIAFRFSDRNWQWYPLSLDRYLSWFDNFSIEECVNLFMDFETFGEHQWADTGIFEFFQSFIKQSIHNHSSRFVTPSSLFSQVSPSKSVVEDKLYDVKNPISWADVDRDLTAWTGNVLQQDTLRLAYSLEKEILQKQDEQLLTDWRLLQTSDHFYYMCTKWSADGDVHAYFSPYDSPFEAYRQYAITLAHLHERLG